MGAMDTRPRAPTRAPEILLSGHGLSKNFGGTVALADVSFEIRAGEVHGLIGENGAGKSTLTRLLCGVHRPDAGELRLDGAPVAAWSPEAAIAAGVVTVHQDVNLIETMSVAENVFLNAELRRGPLLDRARMARETGALLADLAVPVAPEARVSDLPTDQRKMVQLARAVRQRPRVLLLDEPTSSLTASEVAVLTAQVRRIAAGGVGVLYISHYLNEVFEHTARLTILREGRTCWSGPTSAIRREDAIGAMIGGALREAAPKAALDAGRAKVLEVRDLSMGDRLRRVSFDLRRGEIYGIGGLVGAGLGALARALVGDPEHRPDAGEIRLDGAPVAWRSVGEAIAGGLALVTNDRHRTGALVEFSIADNIALPSLPRFAGTLGVLRRRAMASEVRGAMAALSVKAAGPDAALSTLSGGNQQKVMLAKWFLTSPRVLILDEPTLGVDIGAKRAIKDLIRRRAEEGCAVLLLTSEMEDIAEIADRAAVMFRGRIVARFEDPGFTREDLTRAANDPEAEAPECEP